MLDAGQSQVLTTAMRTKQAHQPHSSALISSTIQPQPTKKQAAKTTETSQKTEQSIDNHANKKSWHNACFRCTRIFHAPTTLNSNRSTLWINSK